MWKLGVSRREAQQLIITAYGSDFYVDYTRDRGALLLRACKAKRNIRATRISRYNDNGSIALPMRCPGVSRDDKSSLKAWSIRESGCAETRSTDIPNSIEPDEPRTPAGLVSCSFFLFLLVPRCLTLFLVAPPRFLTDTSWGNDKSSRCTDGPQFGEHFYLTAAAGRIFRLYVHSKFCMCAIELWRDKQFFDHRFEIGSKRAELCRFNNARDYIFTIFYNF